MLKWDTQFRYMPDNNLNLLSCRVVGVVTPEPAALLVVVLLLQYICPKQY